MKFCYQLSTIPYFAIFNVTLPPDSIPSFIFHDCQWDEFELLLAYLKYNHYRTLGIDEYYDYIIGRKQDGDKKVILTFDDGLRSIWSVAFPLLKKFDMKAVYYVNPAMIRDTSGQDPGAEDKYISWEEARIMEQSGFVDIESHSWEHKLCFTKDRIVDFQHPIRPAVPFYRWLHTAIDVRAYDCNWGAPVYKYNSRLSSAPRFFDDSALRDTCINYVKNKGDEDFFKQRRWKKELFNVANEYKRKHLLSTRFEDEIEQELAVKESLVRAKNKIEEELDKECLHFAFPWHISSPLSLLWLKELKFKTVFRFMSSWKTPKTGADPYSLCRVEGNWITSLPGKGRTSVWHKIGKRFMLSGKRNELSAVTAPAAQVPAALKEVKR